MGCRFAFLLLLLCLETLVLHGSEALDDTRVIRRGDFLVIQIHEMGPGESVKRVDEKGEIKIRDLRQSLQAAGLTCHTLAANLSRRLERRYHAPLAVSVQFAKAHPSAQTGTAQHDLKLQPGWVVSIRIVEDKHESLQEILSHSGEVMAPYIGFVKAGGLTCGELAARVKRELEKNFFKTATVKVTLDLSRPYGGEPICILEADSFFAFGRVKKQGKYELPHDKDLTISALLKKVGGYTGPNAVPTIKIVRRTPRGDKIILADAHAALAEKSKEYDLFLRADDVVIVE